MIFAELFAKLGLKVDKASFSTADRMIGAIKTGLGAIVAYKTVDFFKTMVMDTAAMADGFANMAQRIGIGIEPLQQLAFASGQSGGSTDLLGDSLQKLAIKAADAAGGSKSVAKELRRLGVDFKGVSSGAVPMDEALGAIADKIAAMPEGKRAAAAVDAFGKAGAAMVPLLSKGSAGIAELRQEFVDMGGQLSAADAAGLSGFGDSVNKAKEALRAMATQAVVQLLPTLKELVARFLSWLKANRAFIKQRIATVLKGLIAGLKAVAEVVAVVVRASIWLTDHFALVVLGIMSIVTALAIYRAAAIATALKAAVAWAISAAPLVLIALLIAAIILVIEDLWSAFTGGESVLKDVYDWLVDLFVEAIEWWVDAFDRFFGWIKEKIDWLLDKLGAIPRAIKKAAKGISSYLTGEDSEDVLDPVHEAAKKRQREAAARLAASPTKPYRTDTAADRASAAGSPSVTTSVVVNTPPGLDPAQVGEHVATKVREENERVLRKTAARNRGR